MTPAFSVVRANRNELYTLMDSLWYVELQSVRTSQNPSPLEERF